MGYVMLAALLAVIGFLVATLVRERRNRNSEYEQGVTQHREALRREREESGEEAAWRDAVSNDPAAREAHDIVYSLGESAVEELRRAHAAGVSGEALVAEAERIAAARRG